MNQNERCIRLSGHDHFSRMTHLSETDKGSDLFIMAETPNETLKKRMALRAKPPANEVERKARSAAAKLTQFVYDSNDNPEEAEFSWLYNMLGMLDSKASALMRLNGVMLAAICFVLGKEVEAIFHPEKMRVWFKVDTNLLIMGLALVALFSAFSIGLCLHVVGFSWKIFDKVTVVSTKEVNGSSEVTFDFSEELDSLQKILDRRQWYYQSAWRFSWLATFIFVLCLLNLFIIFCIFVPA